MTYKYFSGETVTETYAKNDLALQKGSRYKLTVWIAPAQLADEITATSAAQNTINPFWHTVKK